MDNGKLKIENGQLKIDIVGLISVLRWKGGIFPGKDYLWFLR